ncbi:MGMT family protein [Leucobacter sp. UCMA 4100]|uniref:MGMT family protein n=1 Tax=Leucobacter sp. UCMA 4100 TaxID=2810534 RepID=UPI0022EB59FC|nr:MGMT family protein [Leucobacter sp. UCMA 4100]MDA3146371.1 MGMT family protein [Leucobacter sp. UCMA 4100]
MDREAFTDSVLDVVERIPAGHVMTYGDVAFALGSRAARMVGQVLAHHGHAVPWWRVVPVSGKPPHGHAARAREHYERENIPLVEAGPPDGYRLKLALARLPFDHEIYAGALGKHLAADERNPE